MKKLLLYVLIFVIFISSLSGCNSMLGSSETTALPETAECEHDWKEIRANVEFKCTKCSETHLCNNTEEWYRIENYNSTTKVYKCRICGAEHFTTDEEAFKRELLHSVIVLDAESFSIANIADLNCHYSAGQPVMIKLETITEHYYLVYVNGVEIFPDESYSGDELYTYYTFIMPDYNVEVKIEDCWVDIPEPEASVAVTETVAPETVPETESGYEAGFRMLRHRWDGYGISVKEILTCDLGYEILDRLALLAETGEVIPMIAEGDVNESSGELPTTPGTVWLECGTVGLFRLNPEMTEICRVTTHLGEGRVLQMTDELRELLWQAWYYHPLDFWSGSYEKGEVTLEQVYKSPSAVESVEIIDIFIENGIDSKSNRIVLDIKAAESKTVTTCLTSQQSDDNIGTLEYGEIELVAGEVTSLEFYFYGFYNIPYYLNISIDNTQISLRIDPR